MNTAPKYDLKVDGTKFEYNTTENLLGDSMTVHVEERGDVTFKKDDDKIGEKEFFYGANYVAMYIEHGDGTKEFKVHEITHKNELHMGLILPQYFVMTCGEVMFSITGLEFAFSQVS